jgi:hypothetical protein
MKKFFKSIAWKWVGYVYLTCFIMFGIGALYTRDLNFLITGMGVLTFFVVASFISILFKQL